MTLWGCRLGVGFADCASTFYTFPQKTIILVVAAVLVSALLYYGVRPLIRFLGL